MTGTCDVWGLAGTTYRQPRALALAEKSSLSELYFPAASGDLPMYD